MIGSSLPAEAGSVRQYREPIRLLCVDDDPLLVDAMERYVRRFDLHFYWAYSGDHAYRLATSKKPHLVVTDWRMPGVGGGELASWIRHNPLLQDTIVVVISGFLAPKERERLVKGNLADLAYDKPVALEQMFAEIADWMPLLPNRRLQRRHPGYHIPEQSLRHLSRLTIPHPFPGAGA